MTEFMWGRPEGFCEETGINYRTLLKKYMRLVYLEEGSTFVWSANYHAEHDGFTKEEANELVRVEKDTDFREIR